MKKSKSINKVFFDLNHPADFHLFKHLMSWMKVQGYVLKIVARDKECLHMLLDEAGYSYTSRGSGKHSLPGKYLHALWVLLLLFVELVRFRPGLCMSLSSPYLSVLSRWLHITCITYDDTDINPRLLPLLKRSTYLLSPATYPHKFHEGHFRLPAFKELAYLHPGRFQPGHSHTGLFFRLTRTDSVHHSSGSVLDQERVIKKMQELSLEHRIVLSSELDLNLEEDQTIRLADPVNIHRDLAGCRVFWGNSATMAAEAAVLGIPAIFVSAEKFAYISELESYGLLFHFHPEDLDRSLNLIPSLLAGDPSAGKFRDARDKLLSEKMDLSAFLIWFVDRLPESTRIMESEPDFLRRFIN